MTEAHSTGVSRVELKAAVEPLAIDETRLADAARDLYESARLQEEAETFHANCDECDGEGVPELCECCFPKFDDARIARRLALAKAEGSSHV